MVGYKGNMGYYWWVIQSVRWFVWFPLRDVFEYAPTRAPSGRVDSQLLVEGALGAAPFLFLNTLLTYYLFPRIKLR